jgi:hypothetical protein
MYQRTLSPGSLGEIEKGDFLYYNHVTMLGLAQMGCTKVTLPQNTDEGVAFH